MRRELFLLIMFVLFVTAVRAQIDDSLSNENKHHVGVQANPYVLIGKGFDWDELHAYAFAIRYGYSINNKLTIGFEFSGFKQTFWQYKYVYSANTTLQGGVFARYVIADFKNFDPFAELSLYYRDQDVWWQLVHQNEKTFDNQNSVSGYVAIGGSWRLFTDRLSLDVMYKLSNKQFVNARNHVMTYRLKFYF